MMNCRPGVRSRARWIIALLVQVYNTSKCFVVPECICYVCFVCVLTMFLSVSNCPYVDAEGVLKGQLKARLAKS
jgi:hypothetical protein